MSSRFDRCLRQRDNSDHGTQIDTVNGFPHPVEPGRPLNDPRIVVTRMFPKVHGFAGLRLDYAVASSMRLRGFLTEDNINSIAAEVALGALGDIFCPG